MLDPNSLSHLLPMSERDFDALAGQAVTAAVHAADPGLESPPAVEQIVYVYCQRLVLKNPGLASLFDDDGTFAVGADWIHRLTQGQRMLYALVTFDQQVQNGGVTKFFWNRPELEFEVSDALQMLGPPRLSANYDRALEGLIGKKEHWPALRQKPRWDPTSSGSSWDPFQKTYDMLDLGWFDDAYLNQAGSYNDQGELVLQDPGLGVLMLKRLLDYVKAHKNEFIQP